MIVKKMLRSGDATLCVSKPFVAAIVEREPIHQHSSVEAMESRYRAYFEGLDRYEYVVTDEHGELQAIMVVIADIDIHLGQWCLLPTMAYSLKPGLLFGAYRWLYEIARKHDIQWILRTKTDGYKISHEYKKISVA